MKTGPGLAVMVIRDHRVVHKHGYGLARLDARKQVPIRPESTFRLASLTKQFTAMAIAILVEAGKLKLDERLTDIIHDDHPAREIRVRHLLHHTSGLREYDTLLREYGAIGGDEFVQWDAHKPGFEPTNMDVQALLKRQTLRNYPPGRVFEYSNSAYAYLGCVIERKSGMCYADFLKKRIFTPLEMKDTYVGDGRNPPDPQLAYSYNFGGVGTKTDIDYSPLNHIYGEDGVFSNLDDLSKWDEALYPSGRRAGGAKGLVSDETLAMIFRPGRLDDDGSTGYGFGWFIIPGGVGAWHDGAWAGYRTCIRRYIADSFTIVVLSNYAEVDVNAVADQIYEIYFPEPRRVLPERLARPKAGTAGGGRSRPN
ncbi:MAG: serine hydrolase [Zavarzinella sp.]|nr:serine hydrolase [Zavarzinella sp.]